MKWKCRICSSENEDEDVICVNCGSHKEEDYDATSDEQDLEEDN